MKGGSESDRGFEKTQSKGVGSPVRENQDEPPQQTARGALRQSGEKNRQTRGSSSCERPPTNIRCQNCKEGIGKHRVGRRELVSWADDQEHSSKTRDDQGIVRGGEEIHQVDYEENQVTRKGRHKDEGTRSF